MTLNTRLHLLSLRKGCMARCENDTYVIVAVAKLFWKDMKTAKARKWFNRAVSLNPSLGDAWAAYFAFELSQGSVHEQRDLVTERPAADSVPIIASHRSPFLSGVNVGKGEDELAQ